MFSQFLFALLISQCNNIRSFEILKCFDHWLVTTSMNITFLTIFMQVSIALSLWNHCKGESLVFLRVSRASASVWQQSCLCSLRGVT